MSTKTRRPTRQPIRRPSGRTGSSLSTTKGTVRNIRRVARSTEPTKATTKTTTTRSTRRVTRRKIPENVSDEEVSDEEVSEEKVSDQEEDDKEVSGDEEKSQEVGKSGELQEPRRIKFRRRRVSKTPEETPRKVGVILDESGNEIKLQSNSLIRGLTQDPPTFDNVTGLLIPDFNEDPNRYNFREKYSIKIIETLMDNDNMRKIPNLTAERVIVLGRAKTNQVYDFVSYTGKLAEELALLAELIQ